MTETTSTNETTNREGRTNGPPMVGRQIRFPRDLWDDFAAQARADGLGVAEAQRALARAYVKGWVTL